ncbi:MAG: imidazole glycerol phosphate synthase subunit HisF [Elusimicrobiota bacterium]|jgi:cyclase|nr:imidazole glycerol phosphate synthase subunit HisF [Elusimicrobiota bacterium]
MLNIRIIPCLDVTGGRVVKGVNFINLRDAGDPVEIAERYYLEGADELVFLDITATHQKENTAVDLARRIGEKIFIPFTIGGGIKTISDIKSVLNAGADKISLNSIAVRNPEIIKEASDIFGSQCIVSAIDAKRNASGGWNVYINGGRIDTGIDAVAWAKKVESLGAGEILLTSMDRDGVQSGYDTELLSAVNANISVPLIASGGAGKLEHFLDACNAGASALLAASLFHYNEIAISDLKKYLSSNNINVRKIYV